MCILLVCCHIWGKNLIQDSLSSLKDTDQFNIMTFGQEINYWRANYAPGTQEFKAEAKIFIGNRAPFKSGQPSDKDLLDAIKSTSTFNPSIVVLFSDGILTTNGKFMKSGVPDYQAINKELGQLTNTTKLFTIGTDMSTTFPGALIMEGLAKQTNGYFWLLGVEEQKPSEGDGLMLNLRNSALARKKSQVPRVESKNKTVLEKTRAKMLQEPSRRASRGFNNSLAFNYLSKNLINKL